VNAGQPDLRKLNGKTFSETDDKELEVLNTEWKKGQIKGRPCD
jgi:hypothetical protein